MITSRHRVADDPVATRVTSMLHGRTAIAAVPLLVTVLAVGGCGGGDDDDDHGPRPPLDDDSASDDDDTGDDDTGGAAPEAMVGSVLTSESNGYQCEQSLTGVAAEMGGTDYAFDITYSTVTSSGTCLSCWDFADGVYRLGHDPDYFVPYGYTEGYGAIFYAGYLWYYTLTAVQGHDVVFFYEYDSYGTVDVSGYWDFTTAAAER